MSISKCSDPIYLAAGLLAVDTVVAQSAVAAEAAEAADAVAAAADWRRAKGPFLELVAG